MSWPDQVDPLGAPLGARRLDEDVARHASDIALHHRPELLNRLPPAARMGAASCREIASIWARRDRWLSFLSTGEETVCHFDLTPKNVFVIDGEFVIIDWAFAGRGLLGLDVGPFAVNASADFFIDPEDVEVC